MAHWSRRGFLSAFLLAPGLSRRLEKPALLQVVFEPRYYDVSVPLSLEAINRVTRAECMPGVLGSCFRVSPLLAAMKNRHALQANGPPVQQPYDFPDEQEGEEDEREREGLFL